MIDIDKFEAFVQDKSGFDIYSFVNYLLYIIQLDQRNIEIL